VYLPVAQSVKSTAGNGLLRQVLNTRILPFFFGKKGCEGVGFGVNYADTFWHEKMDIFSLLDT
jgi:hypothetical protein